MTKKRILLSGLGAAFASTAAYADQYETNPYETPSMYSYSWGEPRLMTGIGVGVNIGGGFAGFTGEAMRDTVDSDVGGAWTARVSVGTHIPLGLDIAYTGSAVDISPIGALQTGTLIGTAVTGAVRWNILPHYSWNPYVFAGAGWQHYSITGGFSYRDPSGITFDLRGQFNLADNSDLLIESNGDEANLDTWEATGQLGYEF